MRALIDRLKRIKSDTSGNALILVAAGLPVVFGGAGYAVDTAQWYLIKRELQYAADQGAISGAWAQGNGATGTVPLDRAYQEFDTNMSVANNWTPTRTAIAVNYGTGTGNSVRMTASANVALPFTNLILKRTATISVTSQAWYDPGQTWQPCLLAVDKTAAKSLWFSGSIDIDAGCGGGALSSASNAIYVGNNGATVDLGFALSKGGIDDAHGKFADQVAIENMKNLFDPWEGLTPPTNDANRGSDPCASAPTRYYAEVSGVPKNADLYYSGDKRSEIALKRTVVTATGETFVTQVSNDTTAYKVNDTFDSAITTFTVGDVTDNGSKASPRYTRMDKGAFNSFTVVREWQSAGAEAGNALPGTYSDFKITCNLKLASGVYVIDGGDFEINAGNNISGSNVMFVLKNGAGLKINGGATLDLHPMSEDDLIDLGVAEEDAKRMDGMLIFEDPQSEGNSTSKINGNASTGGSLGLNGTVYLPKTDLELSGNANVTSNCLMIATKTLKISGNTDLSTFCGPTFTHSATAAYTDERVRLVL